MEDNEKIDAYKIILNILSIYNLTAVDVEHSLKEELAREIVKDLYYAGFLK